MSGRCLIARRPKRKPSGKPKRCAVGRLGNLARALKAKKKAKAKR